MRYLMLVHMFDTRLSFPPLHFLHYKEPEYVVKPQNTRHKNKVHKFYFSFYNIFFRFKHSTGKLAGFISQLLVASLFPKV